MQGYNALWMPGMDHAGIATQNVVEQELAKEGLTRHDLGREKFIERVWEWKAKYGGVIIHQLKRLGCSCDWSRERFTMDEGLSKAVREVFVRLYNDGLIYQGDYIVNWCPRCRTAISDLEVEYHQEAGHLWNIRYPFVEGEGESWLPRRGRKRCWEIRRWPSIPMMGATGADRQGGDSPADEPSDSRHRR